MMIGIENYAINCTIGVYPEERLKPQRVLLDLRVRLSFKERPQTDSLEETVDYTYLALLCRQLAEQGHYKLLETFVAEALQKILQMEKIEWAWMRVKKPQAILEAQYAYVEMEQCKLGH